MRSLEPRFTSRGWVSKPSLCVLERNNPPPQSRRRRRRSKATSACKAPSEYLRCVATNWRAAFGSVVFDCPNRPEAIGCHTVQVNWQTALFDFCATSGYLLRTRRQIASVASVGNRRASLHSERSNRYQITNNKECRVFS